jgi:hypothetical protein
MTPPEQFIRDFFEARTALYRSELEKRVPFRKRFYAEDCTCGSRRGLVETSESEVILEVVPSEFETHVVTETRRPPLAGLHRYHLKPTGESWLIVSADEACSSCACGLAKPRCPRCGGSGWIDYSRLRSLVSVNPGPPHPGPRQRLSPGRFPERALGMEAVPAENATPQPAPAPLEPAPAPSPATPRQPAAEFMREYFLAHAAELRRALDESRPFRARFYDPQCLAHCDPEGPSRAETENIVSLIERATEAVVVTRDATADPDSRYHLKPAGDSWLIEWIDFPCLGRIPLGPDGQCIVCNDTGWVGRDLFRDNLAAFKKHFEAPVDPRAFRRPPPEPPPSWTDRF